MHNSKKGYYLTYYITFDVIVVYIYR